jgi:hypothetical protein
MAPEAVPTETTDRVDTSQVMAEHTVEEMTPDSRAHRDLRIEAEPDNPDVVPHDPDGVDHTVIGVTALCAVMIAMLVAVLLITGSWLGKLGAIAIGVLAIPVLVRSLAEKDVPEDAKHHN